MVNHFAREHGVAFRLSLFVGNGYGCQVGSQEKGYLGVVILGVTNCWHVAWIFGVGFVGEM